MEKHDDLVLRIAETLWTADEKMGSWEAARDLDREPYLRMATAVLVEMGTLQTGGTWRGDSETASRKRALR